MFVFENGTLLKRKGCATGGTSRRMQKLYLGLCVRISIQDLNLCNWRINVERHLTALANKGSFAFMAASKAN